MSQSTIWGIVSDSDLTKLNLTLKKNHKETYADHLTLQVSFAITNFFLSNLASQMWCLFRFLPIMIGDLVDRNLKQWHCFLMLWNIVQICCSQTICKEDVPYLKMLIEEHHMLFKEVYPTASIIPKLHYLIHVPDDIVR